eukprot:CAMPEP_0119035662 /NCGR_PEP_ID=MMETSP1177-20130426/2839_1 /TAXON_ID=2985 /ORGANISM="Ochromonas sp, Strain CCMP1899" /LENGTH=194 /DNA_ID=CAMNT_0006994269 /DNA_START=99 /DNA_END=679 /DNA_ORIENTATION=-
MELAPEDKVNMSLDDLIKAKRLSAVALKKSAPASSAKGKPKGKAVPGPGPRPTSAKGGKNNKKKGGGNGMDVVPVVSQRVAQQVGEGKAKRAATANQKRGLNATGKASKKQIEQGGAKEVNANRARQGRQNKGQAPLPNAKKGGARARPTNVATRPKVLPSGLKISFRPADLNKTTDKSVAMQIKAILSKQGQG